MDLDIMQIFDINLNQNNKILIFWTLFWNNEWINKLVLNMLILHK